MNRTEFLVDGNGVQPTLRQQLGIWFVTIGGWLLKGTAPTSIEFKSTKEEQ